MATDEDAELAEKLMKSFGIRQFVEEWDEAGAFKGVRECDVLTMGRYFLQNPERRHVGLDSIGRYEVSTVFLGVDHGWGGTPVLYETMVYDHEAPRENRWLDVQVRYVSRAQALEGHRAMMHRVARGEFGPPGGEVQA